MEKVYSIDEALEWFLHHSAGTVMCISGLKEFEASDYPEAEEFFINANEEESL